jgi:multiple sugar transport system permease protein
LPFPGTSRALRRRLPRAAATAQNYAFIAPAVIFLGVFAAYPIYYAIDGSFKNITLQTLLSGETGYIGLRNYQTIFDDPNFLAAVKTTAAFVGLTVAAQFVVAFGFALLFNVRFLFSRFLRALVLISFVLPTVVTGTIFTWMLQRQTGVVNYLLQSVHLIGHPVAWLSSTQGAFISVVIATVWLSIPFYMSLLLAGLQGISPDQLEAASIDGAGAWKRFWRITLPQMKGPVLITLVLGVIYTSNAFDVIYIMTGGGPLNATTTMPVYAYKQAFETFNYGTAFATTTLLFGFLVLVGGAYIWLIRRQESV